MYIIILQYHTLYGNERIYKSELYIHVRVYVRVKNCNSQLRSQLAWRFYVMGAGVMS